MKKLLVIFVVFFGIAPDVHATISYDNVVIINIGNESDKYTIKLPENSSSAMHTSILKGIHHSYLDKSGSCAPIFIGGKRTEDEMVTIGDSQMGYEADRNYCSNNVSICIAGKSQYKSNSSISKEPSNYYRQCYTSHAPMVGEDYWNIGKKFSVCDSTTFDATKTPVFVDRSDKILVVNTTIITVHEGQQETSQTVQLPMHTLVNTGLIDEIKCIAYMCTDELGQLKDCSTDYDPNNGNDSGNGNGAGNSSSANTSKLNPPHSAKPYMNKLKTKYKISTN